MQARGRSPAQARMPVRSSIESAGGLHPYNDDDEESQGESRIRAGCWDKHGYLAPEESRRAGNPHSHKSLSMIHDVRVAIPERCRTGQIPQARLFPVRIFRRQKIAFPWLERSALCSGFLCSFFSRFRRYVGCDM